jgi:2-polyprenyl-3-methyl-5-hydroxy-6-metoxy-1,4-benzoquinol methylase
MIVNPIAGLFDIHKKNRMEERYRKGSAWGRAGENRDIQAAVELISDRHYGSCLDVGTGYGHYAEAVAPLCDEVLAIDISEVAIQEARERLSHLPNVTFKAQNIRTFLFNEKYDLIVLGEVIYYFGDKYLPGSFHKLLKRISVALTINGRILLSISVTRGNSEEEALGYIQSLVSLGLLEKPSNL